MPAFTNKAVMALSLCGAVVLGTPALAQSADAPNAAATAEGASPSAGEQASQAAAPKMGQGTKAQAEHSAEATAHKSVKDPNNQLGTSLQGRTRPVAEAGSQNPGATAQPQ